MMAVIIEDGRRDEVRRRLRDDHGVQTTRLPGRPRARAPTAAAPGGPRCRDTELVAASMFSIPLFPHMAEETQDEVVAALEDSAGAMNWKVPSSSWS